MVRFSQYWMEQNMRTTGPSLNFESTAQQRPQLSIERCSRLRLNRDDGH